jgi:hypothetical protein
MNLWDRLFSKSNKPPGGDATGGKAGVPVAAPMALESNHQAFVSKLNDALMQHSDVVSGKVHMIGLDEIRSMFGERWQKVSETAHKIARQAIEHRLTPADVYTPYGETNYMIVFAGLSSLEAQMKCALIAREISEKLLGTQGSEEMLQVNTVVFKQNGVLELKPVSDFDSLIQEFEARWAEQQLRQREAAIRWESPEDQEAAWADLTKRLTYVYRPVLSVRTRMVAAYHCEPSLRRSDGRILLSYRVLPPEAPQRFLSRLDLLVLRKAAQDLAWTDHEGKALLLSIPVHYETMARTRTRIAYVSELQLIAEKLRRKLLIELVGIADGIPAGRLNELTSAIATECRGVLLRLAPDFTHFDVIKNSRVYACSMDVFDSDLGDAERFAQFDRFCEAIEHIKRRKSLHGVGSTSLLAAAMGAGFDYVDGDVVAENQEQLEAAYTMNLADIFIPHA